MIMVCYIMAMIVHRPIEVFLEPMRMPVILDHLQMILNGLKHRRRMGERRHDRPDEQCQARQNGKKSSNDVVCVFHEFTARRGCNRFWRESTIKCASEQVAALRRPITATTSPRADTRSSCSIRYFWALIRHSLHDHLTTALRTKLPFQNALLRLARE